MPYLNDSIYSNNSYVDEKHGQTLVSDYSYNVILSFEKMFYDKHFNDARFKWMSKNWNLSFLYAIIYIMVVFIGRRVMKDREKFRLNRSLVAWNVVLAIFSILGMIRLLPKFMFVIQTKGLENSVCVNNFNSGVSLCWSWLFILSKMVELIDTSFIVLRKQKLIFLHYYHHATVLIYCWYSFGEQSSTGPWFINTYFLLYKYQIQYLRF